ncbi:Unknown protein [Striga hermonthica]|uniref:SAWADEE domain-containing protein n=1 Tax=Striga hermonthica TaxID=68872 RepID=A0A9N7RRY3_STRHE|nr:Unknown protein [Striga hermonthica]
MSEKKGGEDSYDLEFKAAEDDAWYSVSVALDTVAQTLTVKYSCSPEVYQVTFSAGGFKTELEVEELATRFRPVSRQVQDTQCRQLEVGTTVCASHGTTQQDLRFYDAVIEAVNHRTHSFAGEEEECLCKFVLFWLHGRGRGTLTSASIANICTLEPLSEIDPRISAFLILAKEEVRSSKSISGLRSFGPGSKGSSSDKSNSSMTIEPSRNTHGRTCVHSWRINNYEQWTSQDEDIGPQDGLALAKHRHFILIHNLEKDIIPSSIKKFIYKKTNILSQAFVFPRQSLDPFARGAIVVDCEKKAQIIYDFLDNPNYIIESSRGR